MCSCDPTTSFNSPACPLCTHSPVPEVFTRVSTPQFHQDRIWKPIFCFHDSDIFQPVHANNKTVYFRRRQQGFNKCWRTILSLARCSKLANHNKKAQTKNGAGIEYITDIWSVCEMLGQQGWRKQSDNMIWYACYQGTIRKLCHWSPIIWNSFKRQRANSQESEVQRTKQYLTCTFLRAV